MNKYCPSCKVKRKTKRENCLVCGTLLIGDWRVDSFVEKAGLGLPIDYDEVDPSRVFGIDVHQYSGVVNWEKAREAGVKFALIKATSGLLTANFFRQNWEGAAKAGILRGSWHWLFKSSDISAGSQARNVISVLKADPGELPMFCDFEWTKYNYKQSNPDTGDLWGLLKPYEDMTGRRPGIYSSPGYWGQYGNMQAVWDTYPLWIANYKVTKPTIPLPFKKYMFWQFSEMVEGADYGVSIYEERGVDGNYFGGTLQELYAIASQPDPTPVPVPVPTPADDPIVEVQMTHLSGKKEIIKK